VHKEVLQKYSSSRLKVYAVWLPILQTDLRQVWKEELLSDARVTHLWDVNKAVGLWFTKYRERWKEAGALAFAWDRYYLFGPQARWDGTLGPLEVWDGPIVRTAGRLAEALPSLLAGDGGDRPR
jgi:hypothetical protein